jgi:lysophospholipase L1-like esterase
MKSDALRRRTLWLLALYVLALHGVLAFIVFKTNFLPLARKTLGWEPPEERNVALYQAMVQWSVRDRLVPDGALVVLGDSLLQDLGAEELGGEVHSFALGGTTVSTLLEGLALLPSTKRAGCLVLGVGANDLKYREPEAVAREYATLLAALPADVNLVALPILPVDETCAAVVQRPYLSNARLRELDRRLAECCMERARTTRVDVSELVAEDGNLRADLHAGDGWHLSDEGDRVLGRAIARAVDASKR